MNKNVTGSDQPSLPEGSRKVRTAILSIGCLLSMALHQNALADSFSFMGSFDQDNNVQFFDFSVGSPSTVTLQTFSYGGGTNSAGQTLFSGGFDPIVSLFDSAGNLIDFNDDGVGAVPDPSTGTAYDSFLSSSLAAGNYTVALTQYSNFPVGPTLANGFTLGGSSINRDGTWALDINGATSAALGQLIVAAPVPLPAAVFLFPSGLVVLGAFARRRGLQG